MVLVNDNDVGKISARLMSMGGTNTQARVMGEILGQVQQSKEKGRPTKYVREVAVCYVVSCEPKIPWANKDTCLY